MKKATTGFAGIKPLIAARFEQMKLGRIYNVEYDRDEIVESYLGAFPTPELRQEHNCSACKSFIRQVGGMVSIGYDKQLVSLWDVDLNLVPESLRASINALNAYVLGKSISGLFFTDMPTAGVDKNLDKETGVIWEHFHLKIPSAFVNGRDNVLGKKSAELRRPERPAPLRRSA